MTLVARYDAYADWYEEYITTAAAEHQTRVRQLLAALLGRGAGHCLDVCCGTGGHAAQLRRLGWSPIGVDLSTGQLRHARTRLAVVAASATALPLADASVAAAVAVHTHTDLDDYPAAVGEVARVLRPGGRYVHLGVHPCFCGAFADRSDTHQLVLSDGYQSRVRRFDGWSPYGVRARVGAVHLPLAALVHALLDAGLVLTGVHESAADDGYPDLLGLTASKPAA